MNCYSCDSKNIIKAFNFEYYEPDEIEPIIMATCDNYDHQDYFWRKYEFYENIGDFKITEIKIHRRLSANYDHINQLCESIKEHIYNGEFITSSNNTTDWYIDGRAFILDKQNSYIVGKILSDILRKDTVCVGGPATSAIPIVTSVINYHKNDLFGFYVRQDTKKHGLQNKIEGNLLNKVTIVDDTCNTGESLLDCIRNVEEAGSIIDQIIVLFDRGDGGLKIQELGYEYTYIIKLENGNPIHEQLVSVS